MKLDMLHGDYTYAYAPTPGQVAHLGASYTPAGPRGYVRGLGDYTPGITYNPDRFNLSTTNTSKNETNLDKSKFSSWLTNINSLVALGKNVSDIVAEQRSIAISQGSGKEFDAAVRTVTTGEGPEESSFAKATPWIIGGTVVVGLAAVVLLSKKRR